jgi:hypothetical protein
MVTDHHVQFYDSDEYLVGSVSDYLGAALTSGDCGIVVATELHRAGISSQLTSSGFDLLEARESGRYLELDPNALLDRFMIDGAPDERRFTELFTPILDHAREGDRQVHIFAEMVSLLALDGQFESALRLESLWNGLRRGREFQLLCAYPLKDLGTPGFADVIAKICGEHDHVIPAESFGDMTSDHGRFDGIAALQQKAYWLEVEIERREELQRQLERALAAESSARTAAEAVAYARRVDVLPGNWSRHNESP